MYSEPNAIIIKNDDLVLLTNYIPADVYGPALALLLNPRVNV